MSNDIGIKDWKDKGYKKNGEKTMMALWGQSLFDKRENGNFKSMSINIGSMNLEIKHGIYMWSPGDGSPILPLDIFVYFAKWCFLLF